MRARQEVSERKGHVERCSCCTSSVRGGEVKGVSGGSAVKEVEEEVKDQRPRRRAQVEHVRMVLADPTMELGFKGAKDDDASKAEGRCQLKKERMYACSEVGLGTVTIVVDSRPTSVDDESRPNGGEVNEEVEAGPGGSRDVGYEVESESEEKEGNRERVDVRVDI